MATRLYLDYYTVSGTFQLPTQPTFSSDIWKNSGSNPAGALNLMTAPNGLYQYVYSGISIQNQPAPVTGTYFTNWWATLPFNINSSSFPVNSGNFGVYLGNSDTSIWPTQIGYIYPRFHVYQWRPGVGKVTDIVAPSTWHVPSNSGSPQFSLSASFSASAFTLTGSDRIVFELWISSSFTGTVNGALSYAYSWFGFTQNVNDGNTIGGNGPASWVEFDQALPAFFTGSAPGPSTGSLFSVRNHPDINKLKATFQTPVTTGSVNFTSFAITSASNGIIPTVQNAAVVPGTNNQEVDITFGADLPFDPVQTFTLWKLSDPTFGSVSDFAGNFSLTEQGTAIRNDGLLFTSRQFPNSTAAVLFSGPASGTMAPVIMKDEFMIDVIFRPTGSHPNAGAMCALAGNASNEANNYLASFYLGGTNNLQLNYFWQISGAVGQNLSGGPVLENDHVYMGTLRHKRSPTYPGYYVVDMFLNGAKVSTFDRIIPPTGGTTGSTVRWGVGRDPSIAQSQFSGLIGTVRVTSGTYTDQQIVAYHTGYINPLVRGTVYQVSSSTVTDSNNLQIFPPSSSFTYAYVGFNAVQDSTEVTGSMFFRTPNQTQFNNISSSFVTGNLNNQTQQFRSVNQTLTNNISGSFMVAYGGAILTGSSGQGHKVGSHFNVGMN